MSTIYITGDTHGEFDRFSKKQSPFLKENDIIIVAGDFGLLWNTNNQKYIKQEKYWTDWLSNKPHTFLFVDGNHENHDRLDNLPVINMFDGQVGKVTDNIYHLKRGEVYNILGSKIFTFGGAQSIDKKYRTEGRSWWAREIASYSEMDHGMSSMDDNAWTVDYIIAHTAPTFILQAFNRELGSMISADKINDCTSKYLEQICSRAMFKMFFCGHLHQNHRFMGKYQILYNDMMKLSKDFS